MKYHISSKTRNLKGEDGLIVFMHNSLIVFAVCDGHGGKTACHVVVSSLKQVFGQTYAESDIKQSVKSIFEELHALVVDCTSTSGCTLSLCIWDKETGVLVTANCGDSDVLLFQDSTFSVLSTSHRLQYNAIERERLIDQKITIGRAKNEFGEYFGQYRLWPGGLTISRAIGDLDSPCLHTPDISTFQVKSGVVVMATDGIWDTLSLHKIKKIATENAPPDACEYLCNRSHMIDDKTAVVLQIGHAIVNRRNLATLYRYSSNSSLSDEDETKDVIVKVTV